MISDSHNKRIEFLLRYARRRKKFDFFKKKSDADHIAGRISAGYSMLVMSAFAVYNVIKIVDNEHAPMRIIMLIFFPAYAAWVLWDIIQMKQGLKVLEEAGASNVSELPNHP